MNKREFINRLIEAARKAREFAISLDYSKKDIPMDFVFTIFLSDDPERRNDPREEIVILGGRRVKRGDVRCMQAVVAGSYLWVDGKVPEWINICVVSFTADTTEFELTFTHRLAEADAENLSPDVGMPKGNCFVPFRIRGPVEKNWGA